MNVYPKQIYSPKRLQREGINPDRFTVLDHPLVDDYMMLLRSKDTPNKAFRTVTQKIIGPALAWQATRRLTTTFGQVTTPNDVIYEGPQVQRPPLLVAIPRAGLSFKEAFLDLLPGDVEFGTVNVRRDEKNDAKPVKGEVKLPDDCSTFDDTFVLDPMLATGGSMVTAIDEISVRGGRQERITTVSMVSCFAGVAAVHAVNPEIHVVTAALDPELNEVYFIVPGLGDAGDRLFGKGSSGVATTE